MTSTPFIQILAYTLPSIITGCVAYYLFNLHFKEQQKIRKWMLQKESQKTVLPLQLQAFERMILFLERISLSQLLIRIQPISENKWDYENFVVAQIEQEFEHNLTQQLYLSEAAWTIIMAAKNTTIQIIRNTNKETSITNANQLRESILKALLDKKSPSVEAISFIKNEIKSII
ncbi:hypothetical protein B0A58_06600 [Flavobacterium branchiophilum NBRC 15030 = ATCC 35035]|uniref:Uncharacterized protein n=1 Tax=Flavobacterium branchiophilum TaxID=55197 RepID=A0A543G800_9FLAO|nr:hypothetical protein [Flavobacterium branchiophilum]OXA76923.1 hypothetical protein B0A58_06600 [Flavobacterium branchiophilum NBRC 15030 = ATCC 35035]TQM42218.1 hypothetical protein BC670_3257 [Flavobacterium branchiophilum]GEM54330.1 hypothetical protein FB1_05510 [Flavobacterium branchiophilum NBRC 15030 = ATCC 35035]